MELDLTDCKDLASGKEIIEENFINWTSGYEIIDEYIQEKQSEYDGNGTVFRWIPYSELIDIKKDNCLTTAILKNGSLHYSKDEKKWIRGSNEKVALRFYSLDINYDNFADKVTSNLAYNCYGISQNPDTEDYILVYNINYYYYCEKCNNDTYYISFRRCKQCEINFLKANFINWTSGNEMIDNYIQQEQSKYGTGFEWIPYNEFIYIQEIGDNCLTRAIWEGGTPRYDKYFEKKLIKKSTYKIVTLRFLNDLRNINDEFFNKVESYLINNYNHNRHRPHYGISQNPDTKIYILVFSKFYSVDYCKKCGRKYGPDLNKFRGWCKRCQVNQLKSNFTNWTSGNERIDVLIQNMQLKINKYDNTLFEWIPYNEFIEIKEIEDNCLALAIWKSGPLSCKRYGNEWIRQSCGEKVYLKYLHNSQDITDSLLNKVKLNLGISQNPDTKVFILVFSDKFLNYYCKKCCKECDDYIYCNEWCKQCQINQLKNDLINWISGNKKIDEFIQKMKLNINKHDDSIFEWIQYNELIEIKETDKDGFATAIWKDGHLYYNSDKRKWTRKSYEKVVLRFLYDLQYITDEFLNKVELYLENKLVFGITQNPDTKVYILVSNFDNHCIKCENKYENNNTKWCKQCQLLENNFTNWTSGNESIDNFIQTMQLKINSYDVIFQWIPYNELIDIKQIAGNCLTKAIWKNGPLGYSYSYRKYKRKLNENVLLKYLNNDTFLNEIEYSVNESYGVSQNPNTNNFILVLKPKYYCENCGKKYNNQFEINNKCCVSCQINHENKKISDLIQEIKLSIDHNLSNYDTMFEWIPYDQFNNIEEIGKGGFSTVYLALWKNGLLNYNGYNWERKSNTKVALKCLHNSQNSLNEFINEVKAYSNQKKINILKIYGISQNPKTKEYIMVLEYAEGGSFNNYFNKNHENFDWFNGLKVLTDIIEGLSKIHQKQMVHRDFHVGNILFINNNYDACISDMGLCRKIDDIDESSIYGVMPYVAPEVLGGKSYTRAADIYSFGMIMYVVATGRQPFNNCAHDEVLAISIHKGNRPEINEKIAPKCYIDLMKKCWDSNLDNRPNSIEIKEIINLFHDSLNQKFKKKEQQHYEIEGQFKETEESRKANLLSIKNVQPTTHTQAIYTSRLLNPFTKNLSKYDDNISNSTVEITDFSNL